MAPAVSHSTEHPSAGCRTKCPTPLPHHSGPHWHILSSHCRPLPQGNKLGHAFAEATELVGAQSWHDLFDTAVIEIAHSDVDRFKTQLLRVAAELL